MPAVLIMPMWQASAMRDTGIAFILLATVSVALRFTSKIGCKISIGADDWWILATLAMFFLEQFMQLYAIVAYINHEDTVALLKYMYISAIFYFAVHTGLRISILAFYRRIFVSPTFRRQSMIAIVICVLWLIPGTLVEILTCNPPAHDWNPNIPGSCINYMLFYVIIMSVEMVIDAFIVAMPIYEISKLQMRTGKKIGIASVFGVGLFVIVTGVIRVILTYTSNPVTLDMYSDVVWYNVNDGAAFLGACMPTYLPMLVFLRKKVSQYGSSIRGRISSGSARSDTRHAVELKEPGSSRDRNGDIKANDGESEVYMLSMTSSRRASSQQ